MSAASHAAGCGVVLGIVLVIFFQQVGSLDLSDLVPALEWLILGAVIGGVLGAGIGWALGRNYLSRQAVLEATPPK